MKELEATLAATGAEHTALQSEVTQLRQRPAAPAYPDLSGKVTELDGQLTNLNATAAASAKELADTRAQLAAARNAAPAYPDLTGRVQELEVALAAKPAAPAYPDLSDRVKELEAALVAKPEALAAAQTETANARHEVAALTKAGEEAQARITSLAAEREAARTAQNELGGALAKLEKEKTQLAAAQSTNAETARQLTELGEKAATAEKQAGALRQERDALSGKMTDLVANVATLQADR